MSRGNLLYDKPDLTQKFGKLALYITGTLPNAVVNLAYEGRLQIHNAIGDCWAELINGALPPGASVMVDNVTHEVVVAWPAYATGTVTLANGDFESGDVGWQKGAGWAITQAGDKHSGSWSAEYTGRGISSLTSVPYPVIPGTPTSLSVQVQQGASSKNALTMRGLILWLDANKNIAIIPGVQEPAKDIWTAGNLIREGSGGSWQPSSVDATVPAGAAAASAVVSANRTRQNKPAWADDVVWTLQGTAVGVSVPGTYNITIRVHDAGGRVADWAGVVNVLPPAWYWPLFANGEQGMVFDYNDLGSLYQDTAHTVPVTAVGQTVSAVRCQITGNFVTLISGTAVLGYDAAHSKYFVTCGSSPNFSGTGVVPAGMLGGVDKSMVFVAELNAAEQGIPIRMGNQGVARDQFNMGNFIDSVNVFELWIGGGANGVTTGRQGGLAVYIGTLSGTVPKAYKNGNTLFNPAATISQPSNLSTRDILIGNSMVNRPLYSAVVLNRLLTASEIATVSATAL